MVGPRCILIIHVNVNFSLWLNCSQWLDLHPYDPVLVKSRSKFIEWSQDDCYFELGYHWLVDNMIQLSKRIGSDP